MPAHWNRSAVKLLMLCAIFCGLLPEGLLGQVYVQIEQRGSLKSRKFAVGDELCFRLKGDEGYYTYPIRAIYPESESLRFDNGVVKLADIAEVKTFRYREAGRQFQRMLHLFALNWLLFSLLAPLVGWPITWLAAIVPASALLLGLLIRWLTRGKRHKMGRRYRLRIVDTTFYP